MVCGNVKTVRVCWYSSLCAKLLSPIYRADFWMPVCCRVLLCFANMQWQENHVTVSAYVLCCSPRCWFVSSKALCCLCALRFVNAFLRSLVGVVPSRMVGVSASVNLPLHHKVQKFSSGIGSPGWSRKKGRKTVVVVVRMKEWWKSSHDDAVITS